MTQACTDRLAEQIVALALVIYGPQGLDDAAAALEKTRYLGDRPGYAGKTACLTASHSHQKEEGSSNEDHDLAE